MRLGFMRTELVTVTKPENARELNACISSFRKHHLGSLEWLFLTESENVQSVREILRGERVEAMPVKCDSIPHGYARQQVAKLYACQMSSADTLVYVDDDVLALKHFSNSIFSGDTGKPVMYYRVTKFCPWRFGQAVVFGYEPGRQWQLPLPFAYPRELQAVLLASPYIERAMFEYRRSNLVVSEFSVMGEFAFLNAGSCEFKDIENSADHWTQHAGTFEDWQGRREELRASLL